MQNTPDIHYIGTPDIRPGMTIPAYRASRNAPRSSEVDAWVRRIRAGRDSDYVRRTARYGDHDYDAYKEALRIVREASRNAPRDIVRASTLRRTLRMARARVI